MSNVKTVTCRIETEKHNIISIKKKCVLLTEIPEGRADYVVITEFEFDDYFFLIKKKSITPCHEDSLNTEFKTQSQKAKT